MAIAGSSWIDQSALPKEIRGKARDILNGRLQAKTSEGTLFGVDAKGRTFANPMTGSSGGKGKLTRQQKLDAVVGVAFKPRETAVDRQNKRNKNKTFRIRFEGVETNNAALDDKEYYDSAEYDLTFPVKSTVIDGIEYSSKSKVLKVQFHDRTVHYAGVPLSVYEQLYYANMSGKSVNATFWNVVRVYERRNLPMPRAQADPESWADYYPKSSNFRREGSQYQFLRDYAPTTPRRGKGLNTLMDEDAMHGAAGVHRQEDIKAAKQMKDEKDLKSVMNDRQVVGASDIVEFGRTRATGTAQFGRGSGLMRQVDELANKYIQQGMSPAMAKAKAWRDDNNTRKMSILQRATQMEENGKSSDYVGRWVKQRFKELGVPDNDIERYMND